ncbi:MULTISPECIES: hypothetical protein [unclassified Nostoc]|uniref:hypothetical protein n=1 Tax=unclassified Nostoc TaxID=2593658 RepID=UPI0025AA6733|nr:MULTISPECIES: hypothetical protein [unclassified Nostoc]MDM9581131.1 hypothetical protein [Nostoc sp. GT001]MDZ7948728.1 hypothetical protein [Nostoc sp. EfeVER01]MDZ7991204.1 hypothetical protein [Nostoc sp. EspVER01]
MTQNPLNDSSTHQSSKTPGLKPVLAAALASLEVPLDQELARYRRTRTGLVSSKQSRVASYISGQPQPLTTISTILGATQSSATEIKTNVSPASVTVNPDINPAPATAKIDVSPPSVAVNPEMNPAPTTAKIEELNNLNLPSTSNAAKTQTQLPPPPPNFSSSIVPAIVKNTKSENHLQQDDSPKHPDDYLESSEALLRSLTEEQPETKKPSNSSDSLLSPLGIGSMLLLLVASLILGYAVFNPKSLPQWNLGNLFNGNSSPTPENTEEVGSNVQPQIQPPSTSIPKYPNLATEEFPEVRDPNDVVGLKPKVQPTPAVVPNPVVPQNPVNPQGALSNPNTAQPTNPIALAPVPTLQSLPPLSLPPTSPTKTSPKPIATSPKPDAEIKPGTDGFYHVVIDNKGAAFASARQVIPDAYLSPNKELIYLGAFKTKEQVKQQMKLLEAKGIKARVQQP